MFDQEKIRTLASGLRFPEGPAAAGDGSVLVPEVESAALVRVRPDGSHVVVAEVGGGANGVAFGPDGAAYVTNNGGFLFMEGDGTRFPYQLVPDNPGGSVQRVDVASGSVETVLTHSDGARLGGLNDIVYDAAGKVYLADTTAGLIHYGDLLADDLHVVASGLVMPNGLGLSPDGTRLYASETMTGRLRAWDVRSPGALVERADLHQHVGTAGPMFWDGLAVDGAGNVCVADLQGSGIRVIGPEGDLLAQLVLPATDGFVTNLCFGGASGNTAYVASGGRGLLYEVPWPWPGLRLNFQP